MSGVDYLNFRQTYWNSLMHSPKGTTWKNHKYIKKVDGRYIYNLKDTAKKKVRDLKYNALEKMDSAIHKMKDKEIAKAINETKTAYYDKDKGIVFQSKNGGWFTATDMNLDDFMIHEGEVYKRNKKSGMFEKLK